MKTVIYFSFIDKWTYSNKFMAFTFAFCAYQYFYFSCYLIVSSLEMLKNELKYYQYGH